MTPRTRIDPHGAAVDLLRRLRVERDPGSATRGRLDGVILDIHVQHHRAPAKATLYAHAELPRASDVRCKLRRVGEGSLHPKVPGGVETPPQPTGDAELDGWLELRGDVDPARVVQWLGPDARRALRALDGVPGLLVEHGSVSVVVTSDDPDAQESIVAVLRDAALALDAARARVSVAAEVAGAHPTFVELGAAMGLAVATCPLAVEGTVEGFEVLIHAPNWGPFQDGFVLVDVRRPGPRGATWDITVERDGPAWRALRAVLRTLGRVVRHVSGQRSSLLARAFHHARQVRRPKRGATSREIDLPMGFTLAAAADGRIVAATHLPRSASELEACARTLITVLASAPPPQPEADVSPYR